MMFIIIFIWRLDALNDRTSNVIEQYIYIYLKRLIHIIHIFYFFANYQYYIIYIFKNNWGKH